VRRRRSPAALPAAARAGDTWLDGGTRAPLRLVHANPVFQFNIRGTRAATGRDSWHAESDRALGATVPAVVASWQWHRRPPTPTSVLHACRLQASAARGGSAWFGRSSGCGPLRSRVVVIRAKVGGKQARATVLCACGAAAGLGSVV
jgi:hypothetical protein